MKEFTSAIGPEISLNDSWNQDRRYFFFRNGGALAGPDLKREIPVIEISFKSADGYTVKEQDLLKKN